MKRTLRLSFIAAIAALLCQAASAQQTATFDFTGDEAYGMTLLSGSTQEYNPDPYVCTEGDITLTFTGKTRWWKSDPNHVRFYGGATMTFAVPAGDTITAIEIVGNNTTNLVSDVGELTTGSGGGSWTGSENAVTISRSGTSGNNQLRTITVTYTGNADPSAIAAPTITGPTEFVDSSVVTIEGPEGSTIYFTVDGTDPTTESEYNDPSPITVILKSTTTLKAIAAIDGKVSPVSTKEFTKLTFEQHTIASLNTLTDNIDNIALTLNEAKVIYISNTGIHLREGDKALIFYRTGLELPLNAIVSGTVLGKYTNYRGIHELEGTEYTNADGLTITPSTEEAEPVLTTIDDILAMNHKCDLVKIGGVTVVSDSVGTTLGYFAEVDATRIRLYGNDTLAAQYADNGVTYDLVAVFNSIYSNAAQLLPVGFTETVVAPGEVAAPTITGSAEFVDADTITITGPEGSTIYYTLDGSEPTTATPTSGPSPLTIVIDQTTTVKAIAVVDGTASAVMTRTFNAMAFPEHTIATLNQLSSDLSNITLVLNEAKVTYVDGRNAYLRQDTSAIMVYNTDLQLPLNAVISGTVRMDYASYYGIPEVKDNDYTNASRLTITPSDEAAKPVEVTIADVLALKHKCELVVLRGVNVVTADTTNYYLTNGEDDVKLYHGISVAAYANDNQAYDVVAVFNNIYRGAANLQPISIEATTTGISSVKPMEAAQPRAIYNLAGQRLAAPVKGINIINGRKVVVK